MWNEGPDALAEVGRAAERSAPTRGTVGLDLVMPDFEARMAGLGRNVAGERITLVQAVLSTPPG